MNRLNSALETSNLSIQKLLMGMGGKVSKPGTPQSLIGVVADDDGATSTRTIPGGALPFSSMVTVMDASGNEARSTVSKPANSHFHRESTSGNLRFSMGERPMNSQPLFGAL